MRNNLQTLRVEYGERRVEIVLNRPEKLNAINNAMARELHALMDGLEKDRRDSVLVFSGAGEKAFAAGADIAELKERRAAEAMQGINANLFDRIARFPFATLAKIRGFCFGGGMELALACDIRIASDDSVFAQPEAALGIIPGAGATFRLPAVAGRGLAREMILSGLRIDAARAYEAGIVTRCVPAAELDAAADAVVRRILKMGPEAVAGAKSLFAAEDEPAKTRAVIEVQARLFESEDKTRRMTAFLEKK